MAEGDKKAPAVPHLGHRQRIKERYNLNGFDSLDDKDLLELLLTYAIPRRDVYGLSRSLVHEFGSFEKVLSADAEELRERTDLTEHTITLLKLVNDIRTKPFRIIEYRPEKLGSLKAAAEYCHRVLSKFEDEIVVELFLDSEYCVTELTRVSTGSSRSAVLPIDGIVENAVRSRIGRVLIAHNHPSGSSAPSSADVYATNSLRSSLRSRGIELVEHIIVAKCECTAIMLHQTIPIGDEPDVTPWRLP
ncbi:MAG: hypothetical protein J5854_05625 [Clostridia bacterium]|nr:hypothetical protein [Clostridia bacterium]